MTKTANEIAGEILAAALASKQINVSGSGVNYQAGEIASAFRIIRDAVMSAPSPTP